VRAAIYARVSTEGQQQRGTIGSQLQVLRQRNAGRPARRTRQVPRPREEWIPIAVPALIPSRSSTPPQRSAGTTVRVADFGPG